jgi:putative transposase
MHLLLPRTRGDADMPKRYELTAEQWRKIEPLLPGKPGDPGRHAQDNRAFVNAVLWVLRSGANWQHMPQERYANWKSAHKRFTRWAKAGIWEQIFAVLVKDRKNDYLTIDSTIVRAHQMAINGKGGVKTRLWGVPEEAWELKFIS